LIKIYKTSLNLDNLINQQHPFFLDSGLTVYDESTFFSVF